MKNGQTGKVFFAYFRCREAIASIPGPFGSQEALPWMEEERGGNGPYPPLWGDPINATTRDRPAQQSAPSGRASLQGTTWRHRCHGAGWGGRGTACAGPCLQRYLSSALLIKVSTSTRCNGVTHTLNCTNTP